MRVAIIGAGFGGLTLAYRLSQKNVKVTIFESAEKPGGLAIGFKKPSWDWTIEHHYHHWFTNDSAILGLAKEIGHKVITVRPKTSTFIDNNIYQLDSPLSLLLFNKLSIFERLRTGVVLGYLKLTNNWKILEQLSAKKFLVKSMGQNSWNILWKPLFDGKFHEYASKIPASWFWARIKKRTPALCYPEGGFAMFADRLVQKCIKNGVKIEYKTFVKSVKTATGKIVVNTTKSDTEYDKIVVTSPSYIFSSMAHGLSGEYIKSLGGVRGLGAVNLMLSLKRPFLKDNSYWLNVNEKNYPFLAVVEHTNFMDKKYYGGEHLVFIGNYLDAHHPYFTKSANSMLSEFIPYLQKINADFKRGDVIDTFLFKAKYAQPIVPLNYSKKVPTFETPLKNVYLCNMSQVYPWDRGTNYAVENGEKVAHLVIGE